MNFIAKEKVFYVHSLLYCLKIIGKLKKFALKNALKF